MRRPAALGVPILLLCAACAGGGPADAVPDDGEPAATTTTATATATTAAVPVTTAPVTTAPGYPSAVTDTVVDDLAFDPLQERILGVVDELGLPGASLLVVHDGELVQQEAWGDYALDTRVPIASASKWLTAAMIMTIVEDGLLELDAPISDYVAELDGTRPGTITLRQLLSFTSGLQSSDSTPCSEDPEVDLQTCARQSIARGLRHEPGGEFRYDSVHLLVAGALAEIVTGESFVDLFEQRIAAPLGMTETYWYQVKDPERDVVDHPIPAGGAVSTLGDYARFLEMIVHDGLAPDGTRILEAATIAEMETNQTEGLEVYGSAFRRNARSPYGLGHWIDWTYPDGATMVSSSPGAFGFRGWVDWENDVFGVYLVRDEAASSDPAQSPSGGAWIYSMAAEAVGGSLPEAIYPHRR